MLLAIWSTVSASAPAITGTMAAVEGHDAALFNGTGGIIGTMAATEAADHAAISGIVGILGHLAAMESADQATFAGSVSLSTIFGTMAATEADDAFRATDQLQQIWVHNFTAKTNVPTTHATILLIAGDTWVFNATLYDPSGNPLPITDPTDVQWTLLDSQMQSAHVNSLVTLGDQPGVVTVTIASYDSSPIAGGTYEDWWRVNVNGVVQTLIRGSYSILADPFAAAVASANTVKRPAKTGPRLVRLDEKAQAAQAAQKAGRR